LQDYNNDSLIVLTTPGVVNFLWWNKKPGIVRDDEIAEIQHFLQQYRDAEITIQFSTGDKVIVKEGPLKNMSGTIKQVQGNKAYLNIHSLGLEMIATIPFQSLSKK